MQRPPDAMGADCTKLYPTYNVAPIRGHELVIQYCRISRSMMLIAPPVPLPLSMQSKTWPLLLSASTELTSPL